MQYLFINMKLRYCRSFVGVSKETAGRKSHRLHAVTLQLVLHAL